jgi:hypothetical protein
MPESGRQRPRGELPFPNGRRVHSQVRDSPAKRTEARVTLPEMIDEVFEKTHWPMIEILRLAGENWPGHDRFTMTQANLLISLIERKKKEMQL